MTQAADLEASAVVAILAAGWPFRGTVPAPIQIGPDHRSIVRWQEDAFSGLGAKIFVITGYRGDEIARCCPDLTCVINPNWAAEGSLGSLRRLPLSSGQALFVSYGDVVFRPDLVRRLAEQAGEVVIAVDRSWQRRFECRSPVDIDGAEKVVLAGHRVVAIGPGVPTADADAEFCGLMRLSPTAAALLPTLLPPDTASCHLPHLIALLQRRGVDVVAVDAGADWAELNAPQDLARFVLGTKSETLIRLRPMLRHGVVDPSQMLTVGEWHRDRDGALARIRGRFGERPLIVRSSAAFEDGWAGSQAGAFLSLPNVFGGDAAALAAAIDRVIASYRDAAPEHQVLIQPMLTSVEVSGVVLTRTLSYGAPYRTITFADGAFGTDAVTGGKAVDCKTVIVHRQAGELPRQAPPWIADLLRVVDEIEALVCHDALDIEFALVLEAAGEEAPGIHILQARPIAADYGAWNTADEEIADRLGAAAGQMRAAAGLRPWVCGSRTLYGVMPDWNPAEIIGTRPDLLAFTLYRKLVTDEVWARQRAEFGYRDVRPTPLMIALAGHPFIDIAVSFSSFVPAGLADGLAGRLVDIALDRLEANPDLHDKVEFEVMPTCLGFDFPVWAARLEEAGLDSAETAALKEALRAINQTAIGRPSVDQAALETLERRFARITAAGLPPLVRARLLLEDCRSWGTPAFAHLARCAFVAMTLLRSAVAQGILSPEELEAWLHSLDTVARRMLRDVAAVRTGRLSRTDLIVRYGHLRPNTYDITSPCYAVAPDRFLDPLIATATEEPEPAAHCWSPQAAAALVRHLPEVGLPADLDGFDRFARTVIEGREYAKLVFTRNLSAALEAFAEWGSSFGLDRETLAALSVEDLLAADTLGPDLVRCLAERAGQGRRWKAAAQAIELPALVTQVGDLFAFMPADGLPNFIGTGAVTAAVAVVERIGAGRMPPLAGRIALIEMADPGYDWLFGHGIAGLITAYGGANSHMAIRAAEFRLPAAIGVGEPTFRLLCQFPSVELDCAGRRLRRGS